MLHAMQAEESTFRNADKLLSRHLENLDPRKSHEYVPTGGWSQLSYDSSELGHVASPFDDIGFLATGGGGSDGTNPLLKNNKNAPTLEAAKPTLGAFLEAPRSEGGQGPEGQLQMQPSVDTGVSRRLDKTISKREHFQEEEASLALSAAMAGNDKARGGRHFFDFSKNSIGLSVLSGPTTTSKAVEDSKSMFGASKSTESSKTKGKGGLESSKSSFGFGASRSSDGPRTIGSKFSSMMRSKNDVKLLKSEERIVELEAENQATTNENKLLQAKLSEIAEVVEKQNFMKDWRTVEELAAMTTEMWNYRSLALSQDLEIEKLETKLQAYERLVGAKERSLCNLENVRHKQEKRLGYLEMQCLQNGIEIAEEGSVAPIKLIEEALRKGSNHDASYYDGDHSFASFQDDDIHFKIDHVQIEELIKSKASKEKAKEKDLGRSFRSEGSNSMGLSDLSGHSLATPEPPTKPNTWLTLDMGPGDGGGEEPVSPTSKVNANGLGLEKYLSSHETKPCVETGTWDPTKLLDFSEVSPRDVGVLPPPPPPTVECIRSAPAPASRKSAVAGTVVSRSTRSKSTGTRRKLKEPRGDVDPLTESDRPARRSKSPGTRRRLKDPMIASSSTASGNAASSSSLSMASGHRRRLRASNSFQTDRSCGSSSRGDLSKPARRKRDSALDPGSSHSLGRGSAHRRRLRKESEFDRQAVSTALENALGASAHVLDMDDDFLHLIAPSETTTTTATITKTMYKSKPESFLVRSKASKVGTMKHDEGLDLDDVFKD